MSPLDCGIVTSRLQVNLDDLLWVLTDSQLKAALVFINSLKDVIKKSSQQSKLHAAEKLKVSETLSNLYFHLLFVFTWNMNSASLFMTICFYDTLSEHFSMNHISVG